MKFDEGVWSELRWVYPWSHVKPPLCLPPPELAALGPRGPARRRRWNGRTWGSNEVSLSVTEASGQNARIWELHRSRYRRTSSRLVRDTPSPPSLEFILKLRKVHGDLGDRHTQRKIFRSSETIAKSFENIRLSLLLYMYDSVALAVTAH